MRYSQSWRPRARAWHTAWVALAALAGAAPAAFAQPAADPAPMRLQQQLQPISGAQLQASAEASPAAPQARAADVPQPAAVALPQAQPQPPQVSHRVSEVGPATAAWFDLQRSNRAAAPEAHPFEGAAASSAYQRYLQSFGKPIPTWFTSVQRSSGGGSSSGAGELPSQ